MSKSRLPTRTGRSALWVIAGLLLASGAIRIASGMGPAVAREVAAISHAETPADVVHDCEAPDDIAGVLIALKDRKSTLQAREDALEERLVALAVAEKEIERNLAALEAAEAKLASTLALADNAAENDLARMTSVYENMKPKEAAALFEEMSPDFAAGFLGRMRPDAAAAIMAGLSAPTAYTVSVVLAGRNASAPTE